MAYPSLCEEMVTRCALYQHMHCSDCNAVLDAIGGGGDDGCGVDGYEDEFGNSAEGCSSCDSLRCKTCAAKNPKCSHCAEIESTPCAHCGEAVGPTFRDLGLKERDGQQIVVGPTVLVCAGCYDCRNCEECRVGAA